MLQTDCVNQEILNYLAEKKFLDMRDYCEDNSGWATIATIKGLLKIEYSSSILGALERLEKFGFVEHTAHLDFDCIKRRYYRIRDDIKINVNYTFDKIEKENEG